MRKLISKTTVFLIISLFVCGLTSCNIAEKVEKAASDLATKAEEQLNSREENKPSENIDEEATEKAVTETETETPETKEINTEETQIETKEIKFENSGGTLIKCGDTVYYSQYIVDNEYGGLKYGDFYLCKANEDLSNSVRIADGLVERELYTFDKYIFYTAKSPNSSEAIYRMNTETGEYMMLSSGNIQFLDSETGDIYFGVYEYMDTSWKSGYGLYKMNVNNDSLVRLCNDEYIFLGVKDNIVYLEEFNFENRNAVLATINSDGTALKTVAEIPSMYDEEFSYEKESIVHFDFCDDWLVMSVGTFQGTGHFFYGEVVRIKADGSELQRMGINDIDSFEIVDDWIYYNDWSAEDVGCYRMHPNGSFKEYLGNEIELLLKANSGNVFYYANPYKDQATEIILNDFKISDLVAENIRVLFFGENAELKEDSDYVSYSDIEVVGDYIYFGVDVHGYNDNDSWRGHMCNYAYYRTDKNGEGLTLLYDCYDMKCTEPYVEYD